MGGGGFTVMTNLVILGCSLSILSLDWSWWLRFHKTMMLGKGMLLGVVLCVILTCMSSPIDWTIERTFS
jgi:hypothetical protein